MTVIKNIYRKGGSKMNIREKGEEYLEYCKLSKELSAKTISAYKIDLEQYFDFIGEETLEKN